MILRWEHTEPRSGVWNVKFSNVDGDYELTGSHPVQAVGAVQQVDFYFRAKGNEWEFETNDERGWLFQADDKRAFQRRGQCKDGNVLPHREAAKIIADCVAEFLAQLSSTDE